MNASPAQLKAIAKDAITPVVKDAGFTEEERQELLRLREENAKLKEAKAKPGMFRLKVSEKGALSIYGFGRFPITLYKPVWLAILDKADEIRAFIQANDSKLKSEATDEDKARAKAAHAERMAQLKKP